MHAQVRGEHGSYDWSHASSPLDATAGAHGAHGDAAVAWPDHGEQHAGVLDAVRDVWEQATQVTDGSEHRDHDTVDGIYEAQETLLDNYERALHAFKAVLDGPEAEEEKPAFAKALLGVLADAVLGHCTSSRSAASTPRSPTRRRSGSAV